jgi:hypothetical protein
MFRRYQVRGHHLPVLSTFVGDCVSAEKVHLRELGKAEYGRPPLSGQLESSHHTPLTNQPRCSALPQKRKGGLASVDFLHLGSSAIASHPSHLAHRRAKPRLIALIMSSSRNWHAHKNNTLQPLGGPPYIPLVNFHMLRFTKYLATRNSAVGIERCGRRSSPSATFRGWRGPAMNCRIQRINSRVVSVTTGGLCVRVTSSSLEIECGSSQISYRQLSAGRLPAAIARASWDAEFADGIMTVDDSSLNNWVARRPEVSRLTDAFPDHQCCAKQKSRSRSRRLHRRRRFASDLSGFTTTPN